MHNQDHHDQDDDDEEVYHDDKVLQVSMLSDQIHNQTDKILDLERTLDSKKDALKKTEDLLQIEMINRLNI